MANGHPKAGRYPIAVVEREAHIVNMRKNHDLANLTVAFEKVVSAALGGKDGAKQLREFTEMLRDGQ